MLDTKRLIAEVAARNGIRVDPDDPAFALVTLVQLVLEETHQQLNDEVRASMAEFERSIQKVEIRAGKTIAECVKDAATDFAAQLQARLEDSAAKNANAAVRAQVVQQRSIVYRSAAIGLITGLVFFIVGLWIGIYYNR